MLLLETQRTMKCVKIVQDWGELIKDKDGKKTQHFMDSYYLKMDEAKWLHENKVMYVGSIKKNHFFSLCSVLEPYLVKSGTSKIAYNRSTGESVMYVWLENSKLGKKYVHSNGYKLKKKPKKDTSCAPYDYYKTGFGGCDRFNKLLANKTWPYVVKSDRQASSN